MTQLPNECKHNNLNQGDHVLNTYKVYFRFKTKSNVCYVDAKDEMELRANLDRRFKGAFLMRWYVIDNATVPA